jgi:hypothetical protein
MGVLDGPYSLTLHVPTTLLIIEVEWGIAVFIGWFFSSLIVFYAVGLVASAVSIISACFSLIHFLAQQTELERKDPPNIVQQENT